MPFNGSGTFNRIYNWVNDAAANIKIRADRMDNEMDGMATALSSCITKNGQTTITANLPMTTYRHTNVGAGVSRTDYARLDQLQDAKINWVAAGGTADAITAAYDPAITTLVDGQLCCIRASGANTSTTPTFSPNSLPPRTIVKEGGGVLVAGDIAAAGAELILRYNLANTRWELLNPKPVTPDIYVLPSEIEVDSVKALTSGGGVLKSSGDNACISWGEGGSANSTLGGNMSGASTHKLTNMVDPSDAQDYATKAYVDSEIDNSGITSLAAVPTTSGSSASLGSVPTNAKRITINFVNVSLDGSGDFLIQINGETSGYVSTASTGLTSTAGFLVPAGAAGRFTIGQCVLTNPDGDDWVMTFNGHRVTSTSVTSSGLKSLAAVASSLAVVSTAGTFDGGYVNMTYET